LSNDLRKSNDIVEDQVDTRGVKFNLPVEAVKIFLTRCTFVGSNFGNAAHTYSGCRNQRRAK
jgi:hypothetical protein